MKLTNFKLGIGIPVSWTHIPTDTVLSLLTMERPDFTLIPAMNGPIDGLRNKIVEDALSLGCTHLIMMDMDQIYPSDVITKLLQHKLPIVGCKVHRRYPPFDPLLYRDGKQGYELIEDFEDGSLVEVDATGTGCLMFDMKVFREMPAPWFKFKLNYEGRPIGEDFGFCQDLRKAGYQIFVDTSIKCGHLSTLNITEATHNLYRAVKKAQEKEREKNGL